MSKFIIIAKPIQLDKKGVVVPGQCLPSTDGWRLFEYDGDDKSEKTIHTGYYDHCRQIQGLLSDDRNANTSDALAQIEPEAEKRRASNSSFFKKISRS